jgi:hypothetical protein
MKKIQYEQEIHEIKLPVGILKHDQYLELAKPKIGDTIFWQDGVLFKIGDLRAVRGWRLVVKKKEGSE